MQKEWQTVQTLTGSKILLTFLSLQNLIITLFRHPRMTEIILKKKGKLQHRLSISALCIYENSTHENAGYYLFHKQKKKKKKKKKKKSKTTYMYKTTYMV